MNNSQFGIIVFSRMGSKRLPGKALKKLGNISLIERVIRRAKCCGYKVILATTEAIEDDPLEQMAASLEIDCFRGDAQNVLKRAVDAAQKHGLKYFARLCGDRPLFSIEEIKLGIDLARDFSLSENNYNPELITNYIYGRKIKGLTTEIVNTRALFDVLSRSNTDAHFEHVTTYFYQNPSLYNIFCIKQLSDYIPLYEGYAIDDHNDYFRMDTIFKQNPSIDLTIEEADKIYYDYIKLQNE